MTELAQRFVIARSWWIASELVRRHPELRLIETHPGGGQYDCLTLLRDESTVVDLNRAGAIHFNGETPSELAMTWLECFAHDDPHLSVKQIEAASGLTSPSPTPATSPAALVYRAVARVLAALVDDRDWWDVRNERVDSSNAYSTEPHGYVSLSPRAAELATQARPDDLLGDPAYRFWALLRSDEPE